MRLIPISTLSLLLTAACGTDFAPSGGDGGQQVLVDVHGIALDSVTDGGWPAPPSRPGDLHPARCPRAVRHSSPPPGANAGAPRSGVRALCPCDLRHLWIQRGDPAAQVSDASSFPRSAA